MSSESRSPGLPQAPPHPPRVLLSGCSGQEHTIFISTDLGAEPERQGSHPSPAWTGQLPSMCLRSPTRVMAGPLLGCPGPSNSQEGWKGAQAPTADYTLSGAPVTLCSRREPAQNSLGSVAGTPGKKTSGSLYLLPLWFLVLLTPGVSL